MAEGAMPDPLADLRDIHLPPPVETFPPAPGWWLLGLLLLALFLYGIYRLYRWWQNNAYRREANRQLVQIARDHQHDQQQFLLHFNELLKRTALTAYPREEVAQLTGESWVAFLDRAGNTHEFSMGAGQVLIDGQYAPLATVDVDALVSLGNAWIKQHREVTPHD